MLMPCARYCTAHFTKVLLHYLTMLNVHECLVDVNKFIQSCQILSSCEAIGREDAEQRR